MTPWIIYVGIGAIVATGIYWAIIRIFYYRTVVLSEEAVENTLKKTIEVISARLADPALSTVSVNSLDEPIVKNFLALDEAATMRLYSQTAESAKSAKTREEESLDATEGSGDIKFSGLGLGAKKNRETRTKETFEPQSDPIKALIAVTTQLTNDNSIRHIDLTAEPSSRPVDRLLKNLETEASQIGLTIPSEAKAAIRESWHKSRSENTDETLRKLSGYVKIKAEFTADYDDSGDLLLKASAGPSDMMIGAVATVRKEWLYQAAEATIYTGSTVRAICFGIAWQWNKETTTLSVLPIAIYSA